jgi:hypothetical protein
MAFGSLDDVDTWIAEPGNSPEKLWEAVQSGAMAGENAKWGKLWLRRNIERRDEEHSLEMLDLNRRATKATEDSAVAARASAVCAAIAVGVSLVALGVAVAALWKP